MYKKRVLQQYKYKYIISTRRSCLRIRQHHGPVERPRDTTAICLPMCKEHNSESYSILGSEVFSHRWPLGTLMAFIQRAGFAYPRQLDAGHRRRKFLQIVTTPHFFPGKTVYGPSPRPLIGSIMVQMQMQLQSDIELAQYLCIDWLIAAMG